MDSTNRRTVYIYGLREPGTDEIRYIGRTVDLKRRLKHHCCPAVLKRGDYKSRWIQSLRNRGLRPELCVLEESTMERWQEAEQFLIRLYRVMGHRLTNGSDGGDGSLGHVVSEETRRKISLANKGHVPWTYGQSLSQEFRQKISNAQRGVPERPEVREAQRQRMLGTKASVETRRKMSESQRVAWTRRRQGA